MMLIAIEIANQLAHLYSGDPSPWRSLRSSFMCRTERGPVLMAR